MQNIFCPSRRLELVLNQLEHATNDAYKSQTNVIPIFSLLQSGSGKSNPQRGH